MYLFVHIQCLPPTPSRSFLLSALATSCSLSLSKKQKQKAWLTSPEHGAALECGSHEHSPEENLAFQLPEAVRYQQLLGRVGGGASCSLPIFHAGIFVLLELVQALCMLSYCAGLAHAFTLSETSVCICPALPGKSYFLDAIHHRCIFYSSYLLFCIDPEA